MARSNTKSITKKNRGGRPSKYSKEVVKKLESIFKVGGTTQEACAYAGISRETYYTWAETRPDFLTKMEAAKHYADIVAKNVVVKAIVEDRDLATAKWWLERHTAEFGTRPEVLQQFNIGDKKMTVEFIEEDNES